jgi:hypothetical protein
VPGVLYAARGTQYSVVIDRRGASVHLDESTLRLQLIGASAGSHIEAIAELPAKSSYFMGNDPTKWTRNIPNFARVRQAGVWPGIDAIYYGNGSSSSTISWSRRAPIRRASRCASAARTMSRSMTADASVCPSAIGK